MLKVSHSLGDHGERYTYLLNLAELRQRAKLTQRQVAQAARLSDDTISRLEQGKYGGRFHTVRRIAAALGVPPVVLVDSEACGDISPAQPMSA
jgi:transcriptional regulator with XRE-family HTH domain